MSPTIEQTGSKAPAPKLGTNNVISLGPKARPRGLWAHLQADAWRHRKFIALDLDAVALYFMALSWTMDQATDGFIETKRLREIIASLTTQRRHNLATKLTRRKLWERHEYGYQIHNFTAYNPTAKYLESRSESGKIGAKARWDKEREEDANRMRIASVEDANRNADVDVDVDGEEVKETCTLSNAKNCVGHAPAPSFDPWQKGFDMFWEAFPKGCSTGEGTKTYAYEFWCRLDPDEKEIDDMLDELEAARHDSWMDFFDKRDGEPLIDPKTWLCRWWDEHGTKPLLAS